MSAPELTLDEARELAQRWADSRFPDIGCKNECGFEVAGVGLACRAGSACGAYFHPGDPHFVELKRHHSAMMAGTEPLDAD